MRAVYIEWEDSRSLGGRVWQRQDDNDTGTLICKTVGFEIKSDKKSVTIAGHITPDGDMSGDITIPKRAITKKRIVRWKK